MEVTTMTRQLDNDCTKSAQLQAELVQLVNQINGLKNDYEKLAKKVARATLAEAGFQKGDLVTWGNGDRYGELSGADWSSGGIVENPRYLARVMVTVYGGKRKASYPEISKLRKVTA